LFAALPKGSYGMVGHAGKLGATPSVFLWRLRHNTANLFRRPLSPTSLPVPGERERGSNRSCWVQIARTINRQEFRKRKTMSRIRRISLSALLVAGSALAASGSVAQSEHHPIGRPHPAAGPAQSRPAP